MIRSSGASTSSHSFSGLARWPPDAFARAIVRAIEKRRLRAIVGWEAYATDWLKRLLPVRTHHLIARRIQSPGLAATLGGTDAGSSR